VRTDSEQKIYKRTAESGSKVRFYSARIAAATLWESDRSPAVCGVAGGAFVDAKFAAGRLPRSLKGMFQWLALPTVTDHFPEGRPPVAG
jgi:hypothetical protein